MSQTEEIMTKLSKEVHNKALQMVIDKLEERKQEIEKLLENCRITNKREPINFREIANIRHELYLRKCEINNTMTTIDELMIK